MLVELSPELEHDLRFKLSQINIPDSMEQVERIIDGKASPIEVIELLDKVARINWLKGQSAAVELHNRLLRS